MWTATMRRRLAAATIAGGAALPGCGGDGGTTGPRLPSPVQQAVIEDITVDHIRDLVWVAEETEGGSLPRLAYAFSLPGVDAGNFAYVTVDPSIEPGQFDPYCDAAVVDGLEQCSRLRLRGGGEWDAEVYYGAAPERLPREREDLAYAGTGGVKEVVYRPEPLRTWIYQARPNGDVTGVQVQIEEQFSISPDQGGTVPFTLNGTAMVNLVMPSQLHLALALAGAAGCPLLDIRFDVAEPEPASGTIRCGDSEWAEIRWSPGKLARVVWRATD